MEPAVPLPPASVRPTRAVTIVGPDRPIEGLFAAPDGDAWKTAVVVVPGESGLDAEAASTCTRLAEAGHGALAIDLGLSRLASETPGAPRGPIPARTLSHWAASLVSSLGYLRSVSPSPPQRVGVVGWGAGGIVALLGGYRCQVGAAISFYGEGPMMLRENLNQIIDKPKRQAAPFLCLLGGEDADVRPEDLGVIRERLDSFGMRHTFVVYPRTRADFCRESSARYRRAEAEDAWRKAIVALETAPRLRHRFAPRAGTK